MTSYLGLDASTQSLTALLIDVHTGAVRANHSVVFGERLPRYQSPKGFLAHQDRRVVHSDPLMWVEALELVLGDLVEAGVNLGDVAGVSGAGQQHGSVYLARSFEDVGSWSLDRPLRDQVAPRLSRRTAPIWMDSSTSAECAEITAAAGGDDRLVAISGSRAIERFTGPQIRKFYKDAPADWARTREIHLVSSFMASLLTASSVPTDLGDAAGMNLLDLGAATWSPALLDATAPGLSAKLRPPVSSATRVGVVDAYFVRKFGFAPGTPVIAFTGDNPSSLIGVGASRPGTAVVSLGTSDTVFAAMAAPRTDPQGFGHVFGNPAGGFMALACFANGSLAREAVAQRFGLSWDAFAEAILKSHAPWQQRQPAPALLRPRDHATLAGTRRTLVWLGKFRRRSRTRCRRARRRRSAGAQPAPFLGLDWRSFRPHPGHRRSLAQPRHLARSRRRVPGDRRAFEGVQFLRARSCPARGASGGRARLGRPDWSLFRPGHPPGGRARSDDSRSLRRGRPRARPATQRGYGQAVCKEVKETPCRSHSSMPSSQSVMAAPTPSRPLRSVTTTRIASCAASAWKITCAWPPASGTPSPGTAAICSAAEPSIAPGRARATRSNAPS